MAQLFRILLMAAQGGGERVIFLDDPRPSLVIAAEMSMETIRAVQAAAEVGVTADAQLNMGNPMDADMVSMATASGTGELYLQKVMNLGGVDIYFAADVTGNMADAEALAAAVAVLIRSDAEMAAPAVEALEPSVELTAAADGEMHTPTAHGYFAEQTAQVATDATANSVQAEPMRVTADAVVAADAEGAAAMAKAAEMDGAVQVSPEAEARTAKVESMFARTAAQLHVEAELSMGGGGGEAPFRTDVRMDIYAEMSYWWVPVLEGHTLTIRQVHSAVQDGNVLTIT